MRQEDAVVILIIWQALLCKGRLESTIYAAERSLYLGKAGLMLSGLLDLHASNARHKIEPGEHMRLGAIGDWSSHRLCALLEQFWQEQRPSVQNWPAAKQSQYSFRHRDFLQLQRLGALPGTTSSHITMGLRDAGLPAKL